ncbi:MAG: amidohydrolase family protein [Bacteroidia bacterium]|nr:amidohydrolase family protein [Bacteroidia bacterium]
MKKIALSFITLFLIGFSSFAQTYITNVTVVDVINQNLIPNQNVVITGENISDIHSYFTKRMIPADAVVIDGTGKYLMPGLTDAHIHFFQNGGLYTRPDAIDLRKHISYQDEIKYSYDKMEETLHRYLQNGITNVVDVGATYHFLNHRKSFSNKNDIPSIQMTGPLLTTYLPEVYKDLGDNEPFKLVQSKEDGIAMVQEQLKYKPDFIKIWYITQKDSNGYENHARKNLPIIQAIIKEAHQNKLKVAVHATQRITAQLAVESGCDFLVHSVDDELITTDFVELLKEKKTILCPTLIVHAGYMNTFGQRLNFSNHELHNADPYQLGSLLDLKHLSDTALIQGYKSNANSSQRMHHLHKSDSISMANLKILNDAGVTIATGTDAGNIGTLHASSYLNELLAMENAGMNNWQIVQASTLNGAKILDKSDEFGSINIGKKANLILLDKNPIESIKNITSINRVINNGSVYKQQDLIKDSPSDLAQRQLNAYNLRNIEAFLEPYADDVEVNNYPNELRYTGKEKMREGYSKMFKNTPNLHCELVARIAQGNVVIDQERVQFGENVIEATAIYHIEKGKIQKVFFIR